MGRDLLLAQVGNVHRDGEIPLAGDPHEFVRVLLLFIIIPGAAQFKGKGVGQGLGGHKPLGGLVGVFVHQVALGQVGGIDRVGDFLPVHHKGELAVQAGGEPIRQVFIHGKGRFGGEGGKDVDEVVVHRDLIHPHGQPVLALLLAHLQAVGFQQGGHGLVGGGLALGALPMEKTDQVLGHPAQLPTGGQGREGEAAAQGGGNEQGAPGPAGTAKGRGRFLPGRQGGVYLGHSFPHPFRFGGVQQLLQFTGFRVISLDVHTGTSLQDAY